VRKQEPIRYTAADESRAYAYDKPTKNRTQLEPLAPCERCVGVLLLGGIWGAGESAGRFGLG
jgi:hypothetical protein